MEKLLLILIAIFSFLLTSTTFAESGLYDKKDTDTAKENSFYLKLQGGIGKLLTPIHKQNYGDYGTVRTESTQAENVGIFTVAGGYYGSDNIRAELSFDVLSKVKSKDSSTLTDSGILTSYTKRSSQGDSTRSANIIASLFSCYLDSNKIGNILQLFAGAGIGVSNIKEQVDGSWIVTKTEQSYESTQQHVGPVKKKTSSTIPFNEKVSSISIAYQFSVGLVADIAKGIKAEFAYSWRDYGTVEYDKTYETKYAFYNKETVTKHRYCGHTVLAGIRFDL